MTEDKEPRVAVADTPAVEFIRGSMNRRRRESVADWILIVAGLALLGSLFLTWSHQFSPAFLAQWGASDQLRGLPHNPNAWQVYSVADVLLALLAVSLMAVALRGGRRARIAVLVAVGLAVAFVLHALSTPPSNGANIFDPSLSVPNYYPNSPAAGVGETLALAALGTAAAGLLLSFTAD